MADPATLAEISAAEDRSPKRLGLSKLTYVLGDAAKDGWTWAVGVTVVLTGLLFGDRLLERTREGRKIWGVSTIAHLPETWKNFRETKQNKWLERLEKGVHKICGETRGPGAWKVLGDLGWALTIAAAIGALAGWLGHFIGLARGPKEFDRGQKRFDQEVEANRDLTKANVLLEDENRTLKNALAAAEATKAPHRDQIHKDAEVVAAR